MKKYVSFVAAVVGIVAFLAGAGFLYDKLTENYEMEPQLIVAESGSAKENEGEGSVGDSAENNSQATSVDSGIGNTEHAAGETEEDMENASEKQEYTALDFTVEDAEGNETTLFSFIEKGKPIVLNFWASWCGPCKNELPDFQAAYEKYDGEIQFLLVNMTDGVRETKEIAMEFMAENGYTLPVYYDTVQEAAYTYAVYSLPTTYFISAEGELVAAAQGMIDGATLEKGIGMIYTRDE